MPPVHAPERANAAAAGAPGGAPWAGWPLALPVAAATTGVAVAGLLVVVGLSVVGWFVGDDSGSSAGSVRAGAVLWLAAHGAAPTVGGVQLTFVPLLAPLVVGLTLVRVGRWSVDVSAPPRGHRAVARAVVTGALAYAAVVGLVAWGVAGGGADAVEVGAVRVLALSVTGAGLALAAGVGRAVGTWTDLTASWPAEVWAIGRGAAAGLVGLLSAAALVTLAVVAVHADRVLTVGAELSPGVTGAVVLTLLCVATLPNAVLWTTSYLTGPGFAVGTGTVVAPGGVLLGVLPGYPLLAAVPGGGEQPPWVWLLIGLPVLAGVLAGLVAARALPAAGWPRLLLVGTAAGLLAGAAAAVLMPLSGGAVGPARMQDTGPLGAASAMVVLTLAMAGCAGAGGLALLRGRSVRWPSRWSLRWPTRTPAWWPTGGWRRGR